MSGEMRKCNPDENEMNMAAALEMTREQWLALGSGSEKRIKAMKRGVGPEVAGKVEGFPQAVSYFEGTATGAQEFAARMGRLRRE